MIYLKLFVIGSSWLVVIHFLYMAAYHRPNKNWLYKNYSLVVSFSFGIYNVLSLIIAEYFGLNMRMRFFVISIISGISIISLVTISKSYNFTKSDFFSKRSRKNLKKMRFDQLWKTKI